MADRIIEEHQLHLAARACNVKVSELVLQSPEQFVLVTNLLIESILRVQL